MRPATILVVLIAGTQASDAWVQIHVGAQDANPPIVAFQPNTRIPLTFLIHVVGDPDITDGSDLLAIRNSFAAWTNVTSSTIAFTDGGTTANSNVNSTDGITTVTFQETANPLPPGVLAVTLNQVSAATGQISDSDLIFGDVDFSTTGDTTKQDLFSTAIHEVGHIVGLDHIAILASVMYPFGDTGDQIALTQDDVAGATEIYPTTGGQSGFGRITGTVQLNNVAVFAAHVVALDSKGIPVVSTVIDSTDGSYTIANVPAGIYRVYAEPYDGPVTSANLFGGAFGKAFTTAFNTTFFGGTSNPAQANTITVAAGQTNANTDINIALGAGPNLNRIGDAALGTTPTTLGSTALFKNLGDQFTLSVSGANINATGTVSISGTDIAVSNINIANNVATMDVNIPTTANPGARNIVYLQGGQNSTLSGALVVGAAGITGGAGGGTPPPIAEGKFQVGAGNGLIDVEWIDPSGTFDAVLVAVGTTRFPTAKVVNGAVIVDPTTGVEQFRGLNGRRLTLAGVDNGGRRFVTFFTVSGASFSVASAATTKAVSGADGINCFESFFGLGTCPDGGTPGQTGHSSCFVATAAFGSSNQPRVMTLRQFRDEYLLTADLGQGFVRTYYANSPVVADQVKKSEIIKGSIRRLLGR